MNVAQPSLQADAANAVPRDYNFAADILKRNLDTGRAGKLAYIDARQGWTYGALAERVDRFGSVLSSLGIRREERVIVCLLDGIDWPTAFLGAIKAGVVPIPLNTLLTESDYRFMLEDSRVSALVVSEALLPTFEPLLKSMPALRHVIVSGKDGHGHLHLQSLMGGASNAFEPARTTCDDACFWLYSSGSTGTPKGAVHIHSSLVQTAELYAKCEAWLGGK